jgi:hypothetical protein
MTREHEMAVLDKCIELVTMIRPLACLAAALWVSRAAIAQPCHPGPRLFEADRAAYEAQARRLFAAHAIPYAEHRNYELDRRVPRCLALGDYDGDDNLWPQPRGEALIKDDMEAEVCRLADLGCRSLATGGDGPGDSAGRSVCRMFR